MAKTLPLVPRKHHPKGVEIYAEIYASEISDDGSNDDSSDGYVTDKEEPEISVTLNELPNDSNIENIDQQMEMDNISPRMIADSPEQMSGSPEKMSCSPGSPEKMSGSPCSPGKMSGSAEKMSGSPCSPGKMSGSPEKMSGSPEKSSNSPKKHFLLAKNSSTQSFPLNYCKKITTKKKIRRLKKRTKHSSSDVDYQKPERRSLKRKLTSTENEYVNRKHLKQTQSSNSNLKTEPECPPTSELVANEYNIPTAEEDSKENTSVSAKRKYPVGNSTSKFTDIEPYVVRKLKKVGINVSRYDRQTLESIDRSDYVKKYKLPVYRTVRRFGKDHKFRPFGLLPLPKHKSRNKFGKIPLRIRKKRKISTDDLNNKENSTQPSNRKKLKTGQLLVEDKSELSQEDYNDSADDEFDDDDVKKSHALRKSAAKLPSVPFASPKGESEENSHDVLCSEGTSSMSTEGISVENSNESSTREKVTNGESQWTEKCEDADYPKKIAALREILTKVLPVPKRHKKKSKKSRKCESIKVSEEEESSEYVYSGGSYTNPVTDTDDRKEANSDNSSTKHSDGVMKPKGKEKRKCRKKAYVSKKKRYEYHYKKWKDLHKRYKEKKRLTSKNIGTAKKNDRSIVRYRSIAHDRSTVLKKYLKIFSKPENPWRDRVTTWIKSALKYEEAEINLSEMNPDEYFYVENVDDGIDIAAEMSIVNEEVVAEVEEQSSDRRGVIITCSTESSESKSSSIESSDSKSASTESSDDKSSPSTESPVFHSPSTEESDS